MIADVFIVDAFAERQFTGNPAAVIPFDVYPSDAVLQAIAAENNLAETAFIQKDDRGWNLRWFTPTNEVPLCGHATLASGHVVLSELEPGSDEVRFNTRQSGVLTVRKSAHGYIMNLPASPPGPAHAEPDFEAMLGVRPVEVLSTSQFYLVVLNTAAEVRVTLPDFDAIRKLDRRAVIVTAPGDGGYDCVSRFFAPADGIDEDPVTGGAHCVLAPFWGARLGKSMIRGFQASTRGGVITCHLAADRVELEGSCIPYLRGTIEIAP